MTIREKKLQNLVLGYLNALPKSFAYEVYNGGVPARAVGGRIIYKKKGKYRINGFPDVVWIFRGQVTFIELKTTKGRLSKDQKCCHEQMEKAGGEVLVAKTMEDVKRAVSIRMCRHNQ